MTTTSHYPYAPAHDSSTHQSTTASSNALAGSPPSPAFALPTSGAAAAGGGYGASAEGTGAYDGEGGATGTGFFTSNRPGGGAGAGGGAGHALPPAEAMGRTFLPPLQPLPPLGGGVGGSSSNNKRPAEGGQGGFGGAHLLSDDETSESGGGTPIASSIANGGGGAGVGGGVASLLGNLPPLAPAPSGSSSTGIGARRTSRAGSAAPSTSGAAAKGKGKAKAAPVTAKDAKAAGKAGGGKKTPQMGVDGKPIQKKKKAGRACAACQKAHLTCDDARPCARCIKKGCPDECVDGARKKAKYLLEIPDELLHRGHPAPTNAANGTPQSTAQSGLDDALLFGDPQGGPSSSQQNLSVSPVNQTAAPLPSDSLAPPSQPLPSSHLQQQQQHAQQPYFDFTAASTSAAPDNAVAQAYDPSSFLPFSTTPSVSASVDPSTSLGLGGMGLDTTSFGSEAANLEYAILSSMLNGNGFALDTPSTYSSGGGGAGQGGPGSDLDGAMLRNGGGGGGGQDPMLLESSQQQQQQQQQHQNGGHGGGGAGEAGPSGGGADYSESPAVSANGSTGSSGIAGLLTAEEAYRSVTKPYPYAQSYHYLVKHLKERFDKNDILRIIRALATFRPSLIALQMPLTEEDETFVERTFQRTLVELNKLISFSGTPTVVWRRTGEICLVGTEFCLLTGWKREELVGKKYIFELFDTASVVEYYESFAKHAFESTATSITMQCVVLGPDGRPVPCAFCFSVRRDLFSCPFLVIGSFLPVLV